jgi:hypothetical protein
MVKLINGRGQLGEWLARDNLTIHNCTIYHTWNIDDPSKDAQEREYWKFIEYVEKHEDEKIVFISTKQGKQEHYLLNKLKAEIYLLEKVRGGRIIRIPKLIGKGICADYRDSKILPFNEIEEIMTPEDAAAEIMDVLNSDNKMNVINGTLIDKRTIYDLIQFGVAKCK